MDYTLVWTIMSLDIKKDGDAYIWLPNAPNGYTAVGYVICNLTVKPPLNKFRCVRKDLTDTTNITDLGTDNVLYLDGLNVRGSMNGFLVRNGSVASFKGNLSNSMPNLNQIKAQIQAYSLVIYFHPDKLTSFVQLTGGSNDDAYWLDLPSDSSSQDRVKKGSLQDASAYFHVKLISGGVLPTLPYVFSTLLTVEQGQKLEFINLSLGKLVEHVRASDIHYYSGNKLVVYALLHGHASYPKPGCVLLGFVEVDIWVRDDTANHG
ncbi:hypothetical protein L1887_16111 [Cichorium endivia]|nr:hypothetical protein L1887_16111 [Cichorium endivia]